MGVSVARCVQSAEVVSLNASSVLMFYFAHLYKISLNCRIMICVYRAQLQHSCLNPTL